MRALSSDGGVPGSGGGSWWTAPVRGRHAAAGPSEPDRSGRVLPDASGELGPVLPEVPAPLEPVEPVHTTGNSWCGSAPEPRARPAEPDRPTAPDRPGSTCPGPTVPEGLAPKPQARGAAGRPAVPAPGAQGAGGYGFVPDASYGVMPSADPPAGLPPQCRGRRVLVAMAERRVSRTGSCRALAAPTRTAPVRLGRRRSWCRGVGGRRREVFRPALSHLFLRRSRCLRGSTG